MFRQTPYGDVRRLTIRSDPKAKKIQRKKWQRHLTTFSLVDVIKECLKKHITTIPNCDTEVSNSTVW